jgi:ankyrin repeat protein
MNGADGAARGGGNDKGGLTPLMYAARQGNEQAAKALLDNGAKTDLASADKSTALLFATINAHFGVAKLLVEHGANPNLGSVDGASPLYGVVNTQWARHSGYPQPTPKYEQTSYLELMKLLLDRGADPNARLVKELWYSEYNFSLESASAVGTTAFWKCAEVGDIDGMKLLVSRGADPNIASRDGVTPLLMASGAGTHGNDDVTAPPGRMTAIRYLVEELHADVNAADTGGGQRGGGANPQQQQQQAVQLATSANNGKPPSEAQIADQLKTLQARQQGQQEGFGGRGGGITALHNAASRGDNEMILYLISKGAKADAVANNGATIVDMANGPRQRIQPYPETIALLEILGAKNSHKCVSC